MRDDGLVTPTATNTVCKKCGRHCIANKANLCRSCFISTLPPDREETPPVIERPVDPNACKRCGGTRKATIFVQGGGTRILSCPLCSPEQYAEDMRAIEVARVVELNVRNDRSRADAVARAEARRKKAADDAAIQQRIAEAKAKRGEVPASRELPGVKTVPAPPAKKRAWLAAALNAPTPPPLSEAYMNDVTAKVLARVRDDEQKAAQKTVDANLAKVAELDAQLRELAADDTIPKVEPKPPEPVIQAPPPAPSTQKTQAPVAKPADVQQAPEPPPTKPARATTTKEQLVEAVKATDPSPPVKRPIPVRKSTRKVSVYEPAEDGRAGLSAEKVAEILKQLKHRSQYDVAERFGISQTTVSRIARENRDPDGALAENAYHMFREHLSRCSACQSLGGIAASEQLLCGVGLALLLRWQRVERAAAPVRPTIIKLTQVEDASEPGDV